MEHNTPELSEGFLEFFARTIPESDRIPYKDIRKGDEFARAKRKNGRIVSLYITVADSFHEYVTEGLDSNYEYYLLSRPSPIEPSNNAALVKDKYNRVWAKRGNYWLCLEPRKHQHNNLVPAGVLQWRWSDLVRLLNPITQIFDGVGKNPSDPRA